MKLEPSIDTLCWTQLFRTSSIHHYLFHIGRNIHQLAIPLHQFLRKRIWKFNLTPNSLIGINHVVKGVLHSTGEIQVKEAGEKEGREVEVEEKLSVLQEKRKKKV